MRVLVIDGSGDALDFAWRAKEAGHDVRHFVRPKEKDANIGKGLVRRVDDYRPHVDWSDIIFLADNTKYVADADRMREAGKLVVGASYETSKWEQDRNLGMQVFRRAGIAINEITAFDDYDRAIHHVVKTGKRYVSKPSGNDDKALSYCSKSPDDMVYMLERWKRSDKLKGGEFVLQEFIEGTEMAVGGWFGPHGWNVGWCENWEYKKLMPGDLGVATGEMGTVLRYVRKSKLADMVLKPLTNLLFKTRHTGYIDVNCIIDKQGKPWPLEFTCRPGWPTFNIQQELHNGDPVEWLRSLVIGKDDRIFSLDEIALGAVLAIPDFPYSHATQKETNGIPINGITKRLMPHLHPCQVMIAPCPKVENGKLTHPEQWATAGDYVLVMSATGKTVKDAQELVYSRLKTLSVPASPMWRTDIGAKLRMQIPELQKHGFATGMTYRPPSS